VEEEEVVAGRRRKKEVINGIITRSVINTKEKTSIELNIDCQVTHERVESTSQKQRREVY